MDGRGGIRQTANVFEALRESADHSGVAMGAKTRSLLTRTHFVRISSAKMHMNQFAHGHERLKQRGALWHGYPKPHAAMRATQVRSSVLGGHLVLFFSPLPSLRDPFMHAQPTQTKVLAARDCAGAMSPLECMKKRLLMREPCP